MAIDVDHARGIDAQLLLEEQRLKIIPGARTFIASRLIVVGQMLRGGIIEVIPITAIHVIIQIPLG